MKEQKKNKIPKFNAENEKKKQTKKHIFIPNKVELDAMRFQIFSHKNRTKYSVFSFQSIYFTITYFLSKNWHTQRKEKEGESKKTNRNAKCFSNQILYDRMYQREKKSTFSLQWKTKTERTKFTPAFELIKGKHINFFSLLFGVQWTQKKNKIKCKKFRSLFQLFWFVSEAFSHSHVFDNYFWLLAVQFGKLLCVRSIDKCLAVNRIYLHISNVVKSHAGLKLLSLYS